MKVDLISYVRQGSEFFTSKTFRTAINSLLDSVQGITGHETIYIPFDYYLHISIKECKQARWKKGEEERLELATIDKFVTISAQIERF